MLQQTILMQRQDYHLLSLFEPDVRLNNLIHMRGEGLPFSPSLVTPFRSPRWYLHKYVAYDLLPKSNYPQYYPSNANLRRKTHP
jgi:hypothetical protein